MESYYFQMDELSVGYNGKPLIEHINIGVKKGEIVTLIGPNGSGKSTILKSITRQLRLLGGRVSFDEQNIHQMSYREMSTKMAVVLTERMRFWELEQEFPNFHFHLSLDRKDPVADAQGVKYYEGFAVNCIRDTYLKDHEAPEDCEYYLCGPPMLIKTVTDYLDSLGVDPESIMYDNFG